MKVTNKQNSGFTLVELAIVIVIIGLLVGGVLQGQELIKQAQIRSAISSIQGYNAAINTFRAKYNEMPGDISRAATFGLNAPKGGSTVNVCATDGTNAATATANGNGNGNGTLESTGSTACASAGAVTAALSGQATFSGEIANFWVHLGNAQLVKGAFSQSTANLTVNTAFPSMPVGTGIVAMTAGGLTYWVTGVTGTITGTTSATLAGAGSASTSTGSLSPSEAFGIDGKLDDGAPRTGVIAAISDTAVSGATAGSILSTGITAIAPGGAAATVNICASGATATAVYNIAGANADSKNCLLAIRADG